MPINSPRAIHATITVQRQWTLEGAGHIENCTGTMPYNTTLRFKEVGQQPRALTDYDYQVLPTWYI